MDIVERLRATRSDWPVRLVALELEAADEIERLREAANDLAQYVSRADWYHYVKPETRAALGEKES